MILVIDANPFISGFLRDSTSRAIILSTKVLLYSPDWLLEEFNNNENELMKKFTPIAKFSETKKLILEFITISKYSEYKEFIEPASKLTEDPKDVPYFALALSLGCAIWSNEKSFKKQSKVAVYSTSDLVKLFNL